MKAAPVMFARDGPLRVFVAGEDPARRAALSEIVVQAGHELVTSKGDADVVFSATTGSRSRYQMVANGGEDSEPPGLLDLDARVDQIDAALRAVAAGLVVRMPQVAETGFRAIDEVDTDGLMTPRELEVLNAIGEGLTNKAIARRLEISLHTVKFHIESIFRKLDVRTRTAAMAKASRLHGSQTLEL
jgi:DNA-binding NarL/FixJ family response regulator